jgi:hypothetical protein
MQFDKKLVAKCRTKLIILGPEGGSNKSMTRLLLLCFYQVLFPELLKFTTCIFSEILATAGNCQMFRLNFQWIFRLYILQRPAVKLLIK